jgi:hypothetical protein
MPGPLVETGSTLVVVCEVATRAGEDLGDAEGDGEGESDGDGDGVGDSELCCAATTGTVAGAEFSPAPLLLLRLNTKKPTKLSTTAAAASKTSFSGFPRGLDADSISDSLKATSGV